MFKNPCVNIKIHGTKKIEKSVYTQEQVKLILEYAPTHRYGLEIIMLLEYGLRRSELLGIQWQDIDFENNILHIVRGVIDSKNSTTNKMEVVVGSLKNEYSQRDLPLYTYIMDMLKERERKSEYVFCNVNNTVCSPRTWSRRHYDIFMRDMQEHYKNQGIDIPILNPHELRHTRATIWVNDNKSLYAIANVMGWADLKMLRQRYAHSDTESNKKLLDIK